MKSAGEARHSGIAKYGAMKESEHASQRGGARLYSFYTSSEFAASRLFEERGRKEAGASFLMIFEAENFQCVDVVLSMRVEGVEKLF